MADDKNYVRTMLMNGRNNRYMAELDHMGVGDYMQLITKREPEKPVVIFDFSQVLQDFHKIIEDNNKVSENQEVKLLRSSIYNLWLQIKSQKKSGFSSSIAASLVVDSEKTLNLIHSRLPGLVVGFHNDYREDPLGASHKKSAAFSKFHAEIEAFLEILLCRIYISARFGFESLPDDVVMTGHCRGIRDVVIGALSSEVGYYNGRFNNNSPVYHACVENIGINPNAISFLLGSHLTAEDMKDELIRTGIPGYNNSNHLQTREISWSNCDTAKNYRVKSLAKLLARVNVLLDLLEGLHGKDFKFDINNEHKAEFESALNELLH